MTSRLFFLTILTFDYFAHIFNRRRVFVIRFISQTFSFEAKIIAIPFINRFSYKTPEN